MSSGTTRDQRIEEIRRAAIPVFAARGFKGTSMAQLAEAAGMSRPALYQYFDNRAALFRAAFEVVLNDATDLALEALTGAGTVAERLEGYLLRAHADGYEALASTPFGADLLEAHQEFAADVAVAARDRADEGLRRFVGEIAPHDDVVAATVIDLLMLSPGGLKADAPSAAVYQRRLGGLAAAAAALLAPRA